VGSAYHSWPPSLLEQLGAAPVEDALPLGPLGLELVEFGAPVGDARHDVDVLPAFGAGGE
jgi:hypothetical protein